MSIRYYAFSPELDGTVDGKLLCGRFEVLYVALDKACGKRKWARTQYEVVGTALDAVHKHAVFLAEEIAKMSHGVVSKVYQILGHYRNDELPAVVASNLRLSGHLIVSNGCDPDSPKLMTSKVRIPWPTDDVSRADIRALADQITYGTGIAGLGKIVWTNDQKTTLAAYYLDEAVGASVKDYEKLSNFSLVVGDVDDGPGVDASDPVLAEAA